MRWEDYRRSDNVEDRRGDPGDLGGGGTGLGVGGGHLGLGAVVVLGLIGWMLGINPAVLIGGAEMVNGLRSGGNAQRAPAPSQSAQTGAPTDQMGQFVAAVLAENEDVWSDVLPAQKEALPMSSQSWCSIAARRVPAAGGANASMGPFYCPNDQKVYLEYVVFQRYEAAPRRRRRFRLRLCHFPRDRPSHPEFCSAFCRAFSRRRRRPAARRRRTPFPSGSN